MEATLANLETEEEIVWMHGYRSYHNEYQKYLWIGGHKENNKWYWVSGSDKVPMSIADWGNHQPDNARGKQDCVMLFGRKSSNKDHFRFDDNTCTSKFNFVCEKFAAESQL